MRVEAFDVIVVGTGAAGYNAASRIQQEGTKTVCIVTEGVNRGTSRNTGSDKQTYYKLGLGGDSPDSVAQMAQDLFSCGSVDGDTALCEAALSARCFMHLVELGVPFPVNRYGEYVGYKTDHDPFARATSAGPLMSKFMTEALERMAQEQHIPVFDATYAVEILRDDAGVCGLLCLDMTGGEYVAFRCEDVILATGGPAGIYADSVYPVGHTGSTGLALAAGAALQNMTEWQYGLASVEPRWNVSGTYMQVLPRFVSVDGDGNEHEFLADYFADPYEALSNVFLKGYQWPFDSRKVLTGSSVVDILVYRECVLKNRRVYLDYTRNPFHLSEIPFEKLSEEAYTYLQRANACFGTPIERLEKMNPPAVELYCSKGLDLHREYLEIALCAQHNNGGIGVDLWWQTDVPGLFTVGECAGTHGITRPGGSALNAGQVGSLRAAQYVSHTRRVVSDDAFAAVLRDAEERHQRLKRSVLGNPADLHRCIEQMRRLMSDKGGAIRDGKALREAYAAARSMLAGLEERVGIAGVQELWQVYMLRSMLLTQCAVLLSMVDFAETLGATRGSALYTDGAGALRKGLEEVFRFVPETTFSGNRIQQVRYAERQFACFWRDVRPLPEEDRFFENVWAGYRKNKNIF